MTAVEDAVLAPVRDPEQRVGTPCDLELLAGLRDREDRVARSALDEERPRRDQRGDVAEIAYGRHARQDLRAAHVVLGDGLRDHLRERAGNDGRAYASVERRQPERARSSPGQPDRAEPTRVDVRAGGQDVQRSHVVPDVEPEEIHPEELRVQEMHVAGITRAGVRMPPIGGAAPPEAVGPIAPTSRVRTDADVAAPDEALGDVVSAPDHVPQASEVQPALAGDEALAAGAVAVEAEEPRPPAAPVTGKEHVRGHRGARLGLVHDLLPDVTEERLTLRRLE